MKRFFALLPLLIAGCAQTPGLSGANTSGPIASGAGGSNAALTTGSTGSATAEVILPCLPKGAWLADALKTSFNILVDGKVAGTVRNCQYTKIAAAPGSHAIRLGDPLIDIGMSGSGDVFELKAGEPIHLLASPSGNLGLVIYQVSSNRARMEIAEIDAH